VKVVLCQFSRAAKLISGIENWIKYLPKCILMFLPSYYLL